MSYCWDKQYFRQLYNKAASNCHRMSAFISLEGSLLIVLGPGAGVTRSHAILPLDQEPKPKLELKLKQESKKSYGSTAWLQTSNLNLDGTFIVFVTTYIGIINYQTASCSGSKLCEKSSVSSLSPIRDSVGPTCPVVDRVRPTDRG